MCVNHGCLDILVPQQFLDRSDVVTAFKQMGSEGMPEGVAGRLLYQTGPHHRRTHRFLHKRLIDVMPPLFAGLGVAPSVFLRENPLPAPFGWSVPLSILKGLPLSLVCVPDVIGFDPLPMPTSLTSTTYRVPSHRTATAARPCGWAVCLLGPAYGWLIYPSSGIAPLQ